MSTILKIKINVFNEIRNTIKSTFTSFYSIQLNSIRRTTATRSEFVFFSFKIIFIKMNIAPAKSKNTNKQTIRTRTHNKMNRGKSRDRKEFFF
jgi:hypothetical protein